MSPTVAIAVSHGEASGQPPCEEAVLGAAAVAVDHVQLGVTQDLPGDDVGDVVLGVGFLTVTGTAVSIAALPVTLDDSEAKS